MPTYTPEESQRIWDMKKDDDTYWRGYNDAKENYGIGDVTPLLIAIGIMVIIFGIWFIYKILTSS